MLCCAAASFSTGPATWPAAVAGEPGTATIATARPAPASAAAGRFHRDCRMSPPPAGRRRPHGGARRMLGLARRAPGPGIAVTPGTPLLTSDHWLPAVTG